MLENNIIELNYLLYSNICEKIVTMSDTELLLIDILIKKELLERFKKNNMKLTGGVNLYD